MLTTFVGILLLIAALRYLGGALWIFIDDSDEDFHSPHVLGLSTWMWRHVAAGVLLAIAAGATFMLPELELLLPALGLSSH